MIIYGCRDLPHEYVHVKMLSRSPLLLFDSVSSVVCGARARGPFYYGAHIIFKRKRFTSSLCVSLYYKRTHDDTVVFSFLLRSPLPGTADHVTVVEDGFEEKSRK